MKTYKYLRAAPLLGPIIAFALLFNACDQDDGQAALPLPSMANIEIGSGNNGKGIIGRDFHFDMDVVAGELIDTVLVKIQGLDGNNWNLEVRWDEFRGMKNTNVHKHFDIPGDAPEGRYDFIIVVIDRNGTQLEEIREIELINPANLPVSPLLYLWTLDTDQGDRHYVNELLVNPEGVELSKDEILTSMIQIKNVKDDGQLYLILVKKDSGHLPETVGDIDFSKAIVYDMYGHADEQAVYTFGNVLFDGEGGYDRAVPELAIGAPFDNNSPEPNPITGEKAWETGDYYFGAVYTNSTHNLSIHHYMEVKVVL